MPIPPTFPYDKGTNIEPFDEYASATVNAGVTQEIINFTIPNRVRRAYITFFGHDTDTPAAWPDTTWRIRINRVPHPSYFNIQDQLSLFTDPKEIGPITLRPNDRVDVTVVNGSATNNLYGARFRGFYVYG